MKRSASSKAFSNRDKRRDDFSRARDPARLRRAVWLRDKGLTLTEIGADLGVSKSAAYEMLCRVTGRSFGPPTYRRDDVAKSPLLRSVRLSSRVVAKELGCHISTVTRHRKHLGIKSLATSGVRKFRIPEAKLGTMPDGVLAAELGCSGSTVARARHALGIAGAPSMAVLRFRARDHRSDTLSYPSGHKALEKRLQRIVRARESGLTLAQIGQAEGITRERVRQLLARVTRNSAAG